MPGSGKPAPSPSLSAGGLPVITDGSQISLPLLALGPTQADTELINAAYHVIVLRCIARFGITPTFPYVPVEPGSTYDPIIRYGLTDLSVARTKGYGVYNPVDPSTSVDKSKKILLDWHASDTEYQVVWGVRPDGSVADRSIIDEDGRPIPDGGCNRHPGGSWGGGVNLNRQLITTLGNDAYGRADADPRTAAVEAAWSRCMSGKGFAYRNPLEASEHFDYTKPPTRDQIKTATADVECKYQTNYLGVWNGVEIEYQDEEIAEHETEIHQYQEDLQKMRDDARELVASG